MDYAQQIEALLAKNLVLKQASRELIRQRMPELNTDELENLVNVLTQINAEQEAGLVKMLAENPHFFRDLERLIIKTMHAEFEDREAQARATAEQELQQNLQTLPS